MKTVITLPDGSSREFDRSVTALDVATDISPRLASASIAARIDGDLCDVTTAIPEGAHQLELITNKGDDSLEVLRHTGAHVLAQAVVRLYGPEVKYTIGPPLTRELVQGTLYYVRVTAHNTLGYPPAAPALTARPRSGHRSSRSELKKVAL